MVENKRIREFLEEQIKNNAIAGAVLMIRKDGEQVCDIQCGYADIEQKRPVEKNTMFRLASMTKPVIAIGIMILAEEGKLDIDGELGDYFPQFKNMKVADKVVGFMDFYEPDPENPTAPKAKTELLEGICAIEAQNKITIRQMLNHSSGMGQGPVSITALDKVLKPTQTLEERVNIIADTILDFEPGTMTGYSAATAYEVLGLLIERVSGMDLNRFIQEKICRPLGIRDLTYCLTQEQKNRLCRLYEAGKDGMRDVTDEEAAWKMVNPMVRGYYSGSAGMIGSMEAYEKIVQMLYNKGELNGVRLLSEKNVQKMIQIEKEPHMQMMPGAWWGLGMMVSENPQLTNRGVGAGTFGWSGAYGTHFYIDLKRKLTVVLGVNCSNIGGAGSPVSSELEHLIWNEFELE